MLKNCLIPLLLCFTIPLFSQGYLEFIENKGQWNSAVKFKSAIPGGSLYLLSTGYKIILQNTSPEQQTEYKRNGLQLENIDVTNPQSVVSRAHAYEVRFLNANQNPQIVRDKKNRAYYNYFIGNDSTKWASHCNSYNAITYKSIYPNIDVRFYTGEGKLKYDIIVYPGGDPEQVQLGIDGADRLKLQKGELLIVTSAGYVKEGQPYTYQPGEKKKIPARYILKEKTVHFSIGNFDKNKILIIDPEVIFASYVGAYSKIRNASIGFSGAYDKSGNFFLSGMVASDSFYISNGAYQNINRGANPASYLSSHGGGLLNGDMLISKFNPSGTQLLCATFLGGAVSTDFPNSTLVDSKGNLVIAGASASVDYPVTGVNYGPCGGITDIFVSRLSNDCTKLLQSRKIGGSVLDGINILFTQNLNALQIPGLNSGISYSILQYNNDDFRLDVTLDASDNIYIAGCTQSSDFPVTANAVQKSNLSGKYKQDAFLVKFSADLSTLLYSTYLGGSQDDAAYSLAINPITNDVYVAGVTASNDFTGNTNSSVMPVYKGGIADGFISVFSNDGSILRGTTYMGTDGMDNIYAIRFDNKGSPYITGTTTGNWPVVNAAWSQTNAKQFIAKLKPDLSAFDYSTVFGSDSSLPNIVTTAFFIDRCEQVYVAGYGGTANLGGAQNDQSPIKYGFANAGTAKMTTTSDALSTYVTKHGGFYYFVLGTNASKQVYGSFFGSIHDSVLRVQSGQGDYSTGAVSRFDKEGVLYQAYTVTLGLSPADNGYFPTTKGAWAENERSNPSMAAVKIAFNLAGVTASLKSNINGVIKTNACLPNTIQFTDSIAKGKQYRWLFGDGSPEITTSVPLTSYSYTKTGKFTARLISVDSNACNISDTSYQTIRTGTVKADLHFTNALQQPCTASTLNFTNTSLVSSGGNAFSGNSLQWDFGDGSPLVTAAQTVNHSYSAGGNYSVRLILNDTNYCNSPDTLSSNIVVPALIKAGFTSLISSSCPPAVVSFTNTSVGGINYTWDFGDGGTSVQSSPQHTYTQSGSFKVTLKIKDNSSCNIDDSVSSVIIIKNSSKAAFSYLPQPTQPNTPVVFTNQSVNSNSYKWLYGDGDSLVTNAATAKHLYNTNGQFKACLIAYNVGGTCLPDTSCQNIVAIIKPVAEVPSAFTPNGDGKNDILRVYGFGIDKMKWSIYNRWGNKIFESSSPTIGWNGKYKGQEQNTGVFVYELEVVFSNGEKLVKSGSVTLLR